jgi:hypothetical protein
VRIATPGTGRGAVIRGVKPRALEHYSHRGINLAQVLTALRAASQWLVAKFLLAFELHSAIFAPVSINWHIPPRSILFSFDRLVIIARMQALRKRLKNDLSDFLFQGRAQYHRYLCYQGVEVIVRVGVVVNVTVFVGVDVSDAVRVGVAVADGSGVRVGVGVIVGVGVRVDVAVGVGGMRASRCWLAVLIHSVETTSSGNSISDCQSLIAASGSFDASPDKARQ